MIYYMQQVFNNKCSSDVIMADKSYQVKFNQYVKYYWGHLYRIGVVLSHRLKDGKEKLNAFASAPAEEKYRITGNWCDKTFANPLY